MVLRESKCPELTGITFRPDWGAENGVLSLQNA